LEPRNLPFVTPSTTSPPFFVHPSTSTFEFQPLKSTTGKLHLKKSIQGETRNSMVHEMISTTVHLAIVSLRNVPDAMAASLGNLAGIQLKYSPSTDTVEAHVMQVEHFLDAAQSHCRWL
jgi:hypothetical protein